MGIECHMNGNTKIKWGSVTKLVPARPETWAQAMDCVRPLDKDPSAHDVLVGRVGEIGRHKSIERDTGRRSRFFPGDLVGLAFGHRYATQQYEGEVPPLLDRYDMLSQAGVCGRVVSAAHNMTDPTKIDPLGYLVDPSGKIVNLRHYALAKPAHQARVIPTILVFGACMDAGKTHMAASIIHGLMASGKVVHAGKLTGTACGNDLYMMRDAGAAVVLDFNNLGFASTHKATAEELEEICDTLVAQLAEGNPDFIVLEVADGIIQKETQLVMNYLAGEPVIDHYCLAIQDALSAPACLELLQNRWNIDITVLSGAVTRSSLSVMEVANLVSVPCLSAEELARPDIHSLFVTNSRQQTVAADREDNRNPVNIETPHATVSKLVSN